MDRLIINCDVNYSYESTQYFIGSKFITNENCELEIIGKSKSKNNYYYVKFLDKFNHISMYLSTNIKRGNIKNPFFRSVYRTGYIGIGKYSRANTPKVYFVWHKMLERSYDSNFSDKYPSYIDIYVDERWHNLQSFGEWFDNNYIEGCELDKDLLSKSGNIHYSDKTCIFIPRRVNGFLTNNQYHSGNLPTGVSKDSNDYDRYISRIRSFNLNKTLYLGSFSTIEKARNSYINERINQIRFVKEYMIELGYSLKVVENFNNKI